MAPNPALYRYIDFIGGNILDATNVTLLQTILEGRSASVVNSLPSWGKVYQQGTLFNAIFNITPPSTIVFTHADASYPIFVLINDRFESLGNTVTIAGSQPGSGPSVPLYLNWSWDIKTSADDATFVDGVTGEPTIEAGQLSTDVDWVDTHAVGLSGTQFAKNTAAIILANFDMDLNPVTVAYINGVFPYAQGNPKQAGLVALTDTSGLAVGNTDSRNSDARAPLPDSVFDVSVADLISSGSNSSALAAWIAGNVYTVGNQIIDSNGNVQTVVADAGTHTSQTPTHPTWNISFAGTTIDNPGADQVVWSNSGPAATTKYDPATSNQGGIFTDSIIYTTLKQKLTDFLDNVGNSIQAILTALVNHIGQPLGSSETHPFPTAAQVGAAPASHVGLPLGLPTSHPALVNSDTSGFQVDEITGTNSGDAYQLLDSSSARKAALQHDGDVYSKAAGAFSATALLGDAVTADPDNGPLFLLSHIAEVLANHTGFHTHGDNNPHNMNSADIGAASQAYVDTTVAAVLAAAQGYTTARTNISIRTITANNPYNSAYGTALESSDPSRISGTPPVWNAGFGGIQLPPFSSMKYLIFTFGSTTGLGTLPMWQPANYYNLGFQIIDTNGNIQQVTAVGSAGYGISGAGPISWNASHLGTTSDGSGTTSITWTNENPASKLKGFELAIGSGVVVYVGGPLGTPQGDLVPLPEQTNPTAPVGYTSTNWAYSRGIAHASGGTTLQHTDSDDIESIAVGVDASTFQVYGFSRTSTHTPMRAGVANILAVFYRQL